MPTPANPINEATTGISGFTGTAFVGSPVTQYNVLTGSSTTSTINNVAPSATSGVPLVSSGAAVQPAFGTAVVAGGGTGNTTFTAYAPITAGTTATGAFQAASTGLSTSGYVLTSNGAAAVPSFQAVTGGAGAWVKLATATASTSATVELTDFSASYEHYVVIIDNLYSVTTDVYLWLRTSSDGGSTFDSGNNYDYRVIHLRTGVGTYTGSTVSRIALTNNDVSNTNLRATAGSVYIYRPSAAQYCTVTANLYVDSVLTISGGKHKVQEDVDAIRFLLSFGNIASGTFTLYGIKA